VIGPYKLIEQIGEGGFGLAFVAEQQTVRRRMSLKVTKPGVDTHDVIARFEVDRQALALMAIPTLPASSNRSKSRASRRSVTSAKT
jgi:serine/threonine protein kinase